MMRTYNPNDSPISEAAVDIQRFISAAGLVSYGLAAVDPLAAVTTMTMAHIGVVAADTFARDGGTASRLGWTSIKTMTLAAVTLGASAVGRSKIGVDIAEAQLAIGFATHQLISRRDARKALREQSVADHSVGIE